MSRRILFPLFALAAVGVLGSAPARADIDVRINIGNAPPPPRFVFQARPHEVFIPSERVYVVDDPRVGDYDLFHYGGFYWVFEDGYWYRASSYRGPFIVVQPRYVPDVIYRVPATRWKHHASGPPGLMKKPGGMPPGQMKKEDRGYGNGNGNGNGHGKGHGKGH